MNPDSNNSQPGTQPANPASAGPIPSTPPVAPQPAPTQSSPTPEPTNPAVVPASEPEMPLGADGFPVMPEPPKKKNTARIVLIAILVLAIIGCGVAAAIILMNPSKGGNSGGSNGTPTSNPDIPDTPDEPTAEETVITDTLLKKDLDEKIAILHDDTTQTDSTINKGAVVGGYSDTIFDMYKTGYLNPISFRIAYVISSLEPQFRLLSADERNVVVEGVPSEYREEVRTESLQGIDGDKVAARYKEVFGEELVHETSDNCYTYRYNSTYNIYFRDPMSACGGTSPYTTYHYKNKYTTSGNNAYVYMSTALVDWEHGNVYCDIASLDLSNGFKLVDGAEVCTTLPADDVLFVLDESNYENYSQYRFVFNRAEDGTYYFSKVEAL